MRHIRDQLTDRRAMSTGAVSMLVTAAIACWLAIGGDQASAAQVSCGDTITTDTTLHHDLVNCPNNGILIGADHVTLNLNGHKIDGNGTPETGCDPVTDFCDFGIAFESHHGVTVKHGSVREFEGGILAFKAHNVRLLRVATSRNRFGNIGVANASRILVRNCSGDRSTSREGNGLGLFDSHHIRVLHSSFRGNVHVGIKPVGSTNTLIKGNLMARNGDEGFLMEGGRGFRVKGNRLVRNGGGITLGPGSHNVITRNHVSRGRDGIRIEKGHNNLVAHNLVAHARRAGIRLGIKHPFLGGAHNVVRRNRVRDSRVDGFVVVKKDRHSLLKRNVAKGAGDDGFDIESRSTTLTRNRAVNNGDLGIEAVFSVIDGGGNKAHGNGNPLQCLNIVCD
jgi:parallel beta-helix repeat protein